MKISMKDSLQIVQKCNNKMRLFFLGGGVSAIIYWFASIFVFGKDSNQFSLIFLRFDDFLADFFNVVGYSAYGDPYHCMVHTGNGENGYPPLCYVLLKPFSRLVNISEYYTQNNFLAMVDEAALMFVFWIVISILLIMLFSIVLNKVSGNYYVKILMAFVITFSAPIIVTIERGNILLLAVVAVSFFVLYFDSDSKVIQEMSLMALGFSFGIKMAPALFGCLLLYKKKYREAIRASIYGLMFLFVPFLFLKDGFANIPQMIEKMRMLSESYRYSGGCSLTNCLASIFSYSTSVFIGGSFRFIFVIWLMVCSLFCKRVWEQATYIALSIMFVPFPSNSYCLVYLIPATILFFNEEKYRKTDWCLCICFLGIFSTVVLPEPISFLGLNIQHSYNAMLMAICMLMIFNGMIALLTRLIKYISEFTHSQWLLNDEVYLSMVAYDSWDKIQENSEANNERLSTFVFIFFGFHLLIPGSAFKEMLFEVTFIYIFIISFTRLMMRRTSVKNNRPELIQGELYKLLTRVSLLGIGKNFFDELSKTAVN